MKNELPTRELSLLSRWGKLKRCQERNVSTMANLKNMGRSAQMISVTTKWLTDISHYRIIQFDLTTGTPSTKLKKEKSLRWPREIAVGHPATERLIRMVPPYNRKYEVLTTLMFVNTFRQKLKRADQWLPDEIYMTTFCLQWHVPVHHFIYW